MEKRSETPSENTTSSETCALCGEPVDPHHPEVWKEVRGWVGGPRKDSMRLREDTGRHAHNHCVAKLQVGQAIDQPSMFDSEYPNEVTKKMFSDDSLPEELQ